MKTVKGTAGRCEPVSCVQFPRRRLVVGTPVRPPCRAPGAWQGWGLGGHHGLDAQAAGEILPHILPPLTGAASGTGRRVPGHASAPACVSPLVRSRLPGGRDAWGRPRRSGPHGSTSVEQPWASRPARKDGPAAELG